MNKSESIKELASALSKFQGEVTNPKNTAKNPQFDSKYAPLQDILSLARPLLSKQGLSVLQFTEGELETVIISTMLLHESGEFIQMAPFTLRGEQSIKGGGKVLNVQGAGSMITYIRRYQVSAILGLASEDDDDGNDASKKMTPEELEQQKLEELKVQKIDLVKVNVLKGLIKKSNTNEESFCKWARIEKLEDIVNKNFAICADALEKAVKQYESDNKKAAKIEKINSKLEDF